MVIFYMHTLNNLRQCGILQTLQTFKPFKPFKLLLPQRRTQTRNTEPETILHFHHLSVTLFKLFLSYPLDIPPISHLYPISYKEVGYRWVIGKKREGKGMNTDKDIPER